MARPNEGSRLVYSTDGEHVVQSKQSRKQRSGKAAPPSRTEPADGYVRLRREKSGRGGKTVTTVSGVPGSEAELDALLKVLKTLCGTGGSRIGSTLEIQGDHRDRVEEKLVALGHRVKRAGG